MSSKAGIVTLDLPTLYAIAALALVVAGVAQLIPWLTGRADRYAMWWACGHLLMGAANVAVLVHDQLPGFHIGNAPGVAHLIAYGMILHSIRLFGRSDSPFRPVALAMLVCAIPIISVAATDFAFRNGYMNFARAGWDFAVAVLAMRIARRDGLHTGWITAFLFGASVPLFLGRAAMAWSGQFGSQVFGAQHGPAIWMAAGAISFVVFRGFSLSQMAAESARRALTEQACRDPLTGAWNRAKLDELTKTLHGPVTMMMIDLDRFKLLNDLDGHAAGDAALRLVTRVAEAAVGTRGVVLRMGGDEFLCVLPATDLGTAEAIGERTSGRFAREVPALATSAPCPSLSIGIAAGDAAYGIADLLVDADRAMYRAKSARRRHPADERGRHRVPTRVALRA